MALLVTEYVDLGSLVVICVALGRVPLGCVQRRSTVFAAGWKFAGGSCRFVVVLHVYESSGREERSRCTTDESIRCWTRESTIESVLRTREGHVEVGCNRRFPGAMGRDGFTVWSAAGFQSEWSAGSRTGGCFSFSYLLSDETGRVIRTRVGPDDVGSSFGLHRENRRT